MQRAAAEHEDNLTLQILKQMEQLGENPPFGRSERSRQWNRASLELFPSRAFGENEGQGSLSSRPVTPMGTFGERCMCRSVPHQELLRTPSGNAAGSANLRSWDNLGPPMSSAPDRITQTQRHTGLPSAPEVSQSTREWVRQSARVPAHHATAKGWSRLRVTYFASS